MKKCEVRVTETRNSAKVQSCSEEPSVETGRLDLDLSSRQQESTNTLKNKVQCASIFRMS